MPEFHAKWAGREAETMAVDLWIGRPRSEMLRKRMIAAVEKYCDVGLCVTVTSTRFIYTGGWEMGYRVGLRNYPRFPCGDVQELLVHAEKLGKLMAEAGEQGSFMIEEHGGATYWLTRRLNDGASPQEIAECDCDTPATCGRTGCHAK